MSGNTSAKVRAVREDAARQAAGPACDRRGCRDQGRKVHGGAESRDLWPHRSVEFAGGKNWTVELTARGDQPWQVTVYLDRLCLDLDADELASLAHALGQAKRRLARANA